MIAEIWQSFLRLPVMVQLWVAVILVPVNMAAVFFIAAPYGIWVAVLAIGGMAPNVVIMAVECGFSRAMALPHLLIWTPLVFLIGWLLGGDAGLPAGFETYLKLLLLVDAVSLVFDYADARKWWNGARAIA